MGPDQAQVTGVVFDHQNGNPLLDRCTHSPFSITRTGDVASASPRIAGIRGALPGTRIRPGSLAILRQAH